LPELDKNVKEVKDIAAELLCARVETIEAVGGGRNSRVYRLDAGQSRSYAFKVYFRHASDSRNRLDTEYNSLCILRNHGVQCVPMPVTASQEHCCAIYDWIDGLKIGPDDMTDEAIDATTSFVGCLAELREQPDTRCLGSASEA
jgi:hypothetical protein